MSDEIEFTKWSNRKRLRALLIITFVLCFIGTVVGLPLMATFANGGSNPATTTSTGITTSAPTTTVSTTTTGTTTTSTTTTSTTTKASTTTRPPTVTSTGTGTVTTRPIPESGWQQWTTWSGCSVTCGNGESVRSRECLITTGSEGTVICRNKTPPLADDFVRKGVLFPHFSLFQGLSVVG